MKTSNYFVQKNIVSDLYIGTGAGKYLIQDIQNAQKEIKIVSPYISVKLIQRLSELAARGIAVTLVTGNNCCKEMKNFVRTAIRQTAIVNPDVLIKQNRAKKINLINKVICFILIFLPMLAPAVLGDISTIGSDNWWWYLLGLMPMIIGIVSIICYEQHYHKIRNLNPYVYSYHPNFNLYVLPTQKYNASPIHSKIYCIDDQVAYVGSYNFTTNGIENNYETSVRIKSNEAVKAISDNIDVLIKAKQGLYCTCADLGKMYYEHNK